MTQTQPQTLHCPHCHKPFTCNPGGDCWCKTYPTVKIPEDLKSDQCLCSCVLDRLIEEDNNAEEPTSSKKGHPQG